MKNNLNYSEHAKYWDWSGYNRTETLLEVFNSCGFSVNNEYGNYSKDKWTSNSDKWILELTKM